MHRLSSNQASSGATRATKSVTTADYGGVRLVCCRFKIKILLAVIRVEFKFITPNDFYTGLLAVAEDVGVVGINRSGISYLGNCDNLAVEFNLCPWVGWPFALDPIFTNSLGTFNRGADIKRSYAERRLLQLGHVIV